MTTAAVKMRPTTNSCGQIGGKCGSDLHRQISHEHCHRVKQQCWDRRDEKAAHVAAKKEQGTIILMNVRGEHAVRDTVRSEHTLTLGSRTHDVSALKAPMSSLGTYFGGRCRFCFGNSDPAGKELLTQDMVTST